MSPGVAVVVPAHNEEARVGRCVDSVARALLAVVGRDGVSHGVFVLAADRCEDLTVARAGHAWHRAVGGSDAVRLHVVEGRWGSAGGARAAGFRDALDLLEAHGDPWPPAGGGDVGVEGPHDRDWAATTDADSVVPPHWLDYQLSRAARGVDLVLGTVEPDPAECPAAVVHRWHAQHRLTEGHPYVHAANMGVRAGAYRRAGGFPPRERGEDEALVAALRRQGARVEATDRCRVVTSGRLHARAASGFAGYLRELAGAASPIAEGLESP